MSQFVRRALNLSIASLLCGLASGASAQGTTTTETTEVTTPAPPPAETYTTVTTAPTAPPAASTTYTTTTPSSSRTYVDTETYDGLPNRHYLSSGATLLTISYIPSVIVAGVKDWHGDTSLFYPVVGPWMYLKREPHDAGGKALLVIDGLAQDLGALDILLGFFIPERKARAVTRYTNNDKLRVLPRVSRYRAQSNGPMGMNIGLAASGHF
jgi:hypothetical protein